MVTAIYPGTFDPITNGHIDIAKRAAKLFDEGTNKVLNIIKDIRSSQNITTIAGGGDTIAAIKKTNTENSFTYISTGGGAFLEWLEGKESPGVKALRENQLS